MLDYTPPKFRFIVGSYDVTAIVDQWEIHAKALEINTDGCWEGSFTLFASADGRTRSLFPDTTLDPLTNPLIWRPSQSPVKISVEFDGVFYGLPVMRVDKYTWNPQTREGQGQLIQFAQSINADRPAETPELKLGQQITLKEIIETLITAAQKDSAQQRPFAIEGITGQLDSPMTTRNPIADVQKLCGVNWRWLTIDNTETIRTVSGLPEDHPILFSRSIDRVAWEPDIQNINFAAPKVIITGSRQVAEAPCTCTPPPDHNKYVDAKGRTKQQATQELKPYKEVYTTSKLLTETLAEKKTIMYKYLDKAVTGGDISYIELIDFGIDPGVSYDIRSFTNKANPVTCKDFDEMTPIATVTVKEWPRGRISTKFGLDGNFSIAEIIIEGPTIKGRLVPLGTINTQDPQNLNLMWVSKEELKNDRNTGKCGPVDPRTGRGSCVTKPPLQEAAQPGPEIPLRTESIRAEAKVIYSGWDPLIQSPHIEEVGFIPSQAHADKLATAIVNREERRRNAVQVSMPIRSLPEYFMAGCPIVGRARVHDGDFGFEAVIISNAPDRSEISFSCGRMNRLDSPVPSPYTMAPYIPSDGLQLNTPDTVTAFTGVVNYIQLVASGGVA